MKVHKFVVYVHDFEEYGAEDFVTTLENEGHMVDETQTVDVDDDDWHDDHPLNYPDKISKAFQKLLKAQK